MLYYVWDIFSSHSHYSWDRCQLEKSFQTRLLPSLTKIIILSAVVCQFVTGLICMNQVDLN